MQGVGVGHVLHLVMHLIDIHFIGVIDPFFSSLLDFILYFPLCRLGFASSGDLLDIGHDMFTVGTFTQSLVRHGVMAWLVTFSTCDRPRVFFHALLALRGMVWAVNWLSCRRGVRPCAGHVFPRLGVVKRPSRFGARRFTSTIVRGFSVITRRS